MDAGRLLQVGTPEEIYEHPRTRMVADFIGQTNFLAAVAQGQGEARLADGRTVNVPPGSTSGVAITLALRPEKLSVVPAGEPSPSGANQLVGVVERRVYLGSSLTYEVALEGVTLRVRQENTPSVAQCREGDRVGIRWDPASTTVLEE
ncbi:MAG: TOBE domain-containing protein [Acidobacteria bacterium]|nr:TOBE domain-containing protein [Acidobacteriota bacterium]